MQLAKFIRPVAWILATVFIIVFWIVMFGGLRWLMGWGP